jgi:oligoribonuclease (3'-5' exoribonuclease)
MTTDDNTNKEYRPAYLCWCDLETTGFHSKTDLILEMAWVLTEFTYPYYEIRRGHYLLEQPSLAGRLADGSVDPFVVEMHTKNGLLEALKEPKATLFSLSSVEKMLLDLSEGWSLDKESKVCLAGHSVHFDLGFLRAQMPTFAKRLSHRVFDASAISLHCRSMGMPRVPRQEAHRSKEDVMEAINHVRLCTRWLLSLDAIVKAGLE